MKELRDVYNTTRFTNPGSIGYSGKKHVGTVTNVNRGDDGKIELEWSIGEKMEDEASDTERNEGEASSIHTRKQTEQWFDRRVAEVLMYELGVEELENLEGKEIAVYAGSTPGGGKLGGTSTNHYGILIPKNSEYYRAYGVSTLKMPFMSFMIVSMTTVPFMLLSLGFLSAAIFNGETSGAGLAVVFVIFALLSYLAARHDVEEPVIGLFRDFSMLVQS